MDTPGSSEGHTHTYTQTHTHTHTHAHTHTHTRTHARTHTHTHTPALPVKCSFNGMLWRKLQKLQKGDETRLIIETETRRARSVCLVCFFVVFVCLSVCLTSCVCLSRPDVSYVVDRALYANLPPFFFLSSISLILALPTKHTKSSSTIQRTIQ